MAKETGMGARFLLSGRNISGDVASLQRIGGGPAPWDTTDITQSAISRKGLKIDGGMSITTFFSTETDRSFDALSPLPTAQVMGTYCHRSTIGSPAASCQARQVDYDPTRDDAGALTLTTNLLSDGAGVEWGVLHTAVGRTEVVDTNGAGVDAGASSAVGLAAYLHVSALAGSDVTVALQSSSDDAIGDPYAAVTAGAFTAVTTAPNWQRINTPNNQAVERWLRVVTTGGFTSVTFTVAVVRYEVAVTL